ncbi:hypothetical protein AMJ47_01525 [Parcubacteria bacterium DG_72]|nr:MAG: hypothetical protein AMJ47_01525 [Parcubacteria bacterium DG_72]
MPFGDQTGPLGQGPMTGRGAGYCGGYDRPGYANPIPGRGVGFGRGWFGRGRGWRNWYRATGLSGWQRARMGYPAWGGGGYYSPAKPTVKEEREMLTEELEILREEMKTLEDRLEELKKKK